MPVANKLPSREFLKACFVVENGGLTWRERPADHFASEEAAKAWNRRFAGKVAGRITKFGYVQTQLTVNGRAISLYAHRAVFLMHYGYEPEEVDHVNMNKADNRPENLRAASRQQNKRNTRPKSAFGKGVMYDKSRGRFVAAATVNNKRKTIGRFDTPEEAQSAYLAYVTPKYGEFLRTE